MYSIIHNVKNYFKGNLFPILKKLCRIFVSITDINKRRFDACLYGNCADLINDYYSCSCDDGYNG